MADVNFLPSGAGTAATASVRVTQVLLCCCQFSGFVLNDHPFAINMACLVYPFALDIVASDRSCLVCTPSSSTLGEIPLHAVKSEYPDVPKTHLVFES